MQAEGNVAMMDDEQFQQIKRILTLIKEHLAAHDRHLESHDIHISLLEACVRDELGMPEKESKPS